MTIQFDRTDAGGSRLQRTVVSTPPVTHFGWLYVPFTGFEQALWCEAQIAAGRRVRHRTWGNSGSSSVEASNISSWGAGGNAGANEDLSNEAGLEPVMVVVASDSSVTVFTKNNPTGVVVNTTNPTASDFTSADTLLLGASYFDGAYQQRSSMHIAEYARWTGAALGATHYAALTATTPPKPEDISVPVGAVLDDVWPFNPPGAAGTAVTGTLAGIVNGRAFTIVGDVRVSSRTSPVSRAPAAPVITGPTGAAGAASITHSVNENQNNAGTWSATGGTSWSLSGTDAALLSISSGGVVTLASGNFDHEAKASYSFNVLRDAVAQAVTLNITDQAEAPLAPTIGTATAGNAQATVTFTPPNNTGRPPITSYRVTSTPGGLFADGAASPITVTGLTNGVSYTFSVTATNDEGTGPASAQSNSVTPTPGGTAPTITVQPANQTVTAGATATFSVTATGSGLTYQWRRNGTNISGATSSSYTTPATTVSGGSANSGDVYSVVVTGDTAPAATSNNATLTVNAGSPPPPPPPSSGHDVGPIFNNTYAAPLEGTTVHFSWYANGRIGSLTGITPTEGTGVVGSDGMLAIAPSGAGCVFVAKRNAGATTDDVFYQAFAS